MWLQSRLGCPCWQDLAGSAAPAPRPLLSVLLPLSAPRGGAARPLQLPTQQILLRGISLHAASRAEEEAELLTPSCSRADIDEILPLCLHPSTATRHLMAVGWVGYRGV